MLNTLKNLFGKDELVKVKVAKRTAKVETRAEKLYQKNKNYLTYYQKVVMLLGLQFKRTLI